jgi:nicotinate-nucleotide adenylyltransferase
VWFLVSPGNPLKDTRALPPLGVRVRAARLLLNHPRLKVTGTEAAFNTRYTADTLETLARRAPGVQFVWLMGADNLAQFHRWQRWRDIARLMPIAVYHRPGHGFAALSSPTAQTLAYRRLPEQAASLLPFMPAPAFTYLTGVTSPLSSTALRRAGQRANAAVSQT